MDAILRERVRVAIKKLEIALGYCCWDSELKYQPNVERAHRVLAELERDMADGTGKTPLELLDLEPKVITLLYQSGVETIERLVQMSDAELLKIDRIRAKRLDQIDESLMECGLKRKREGA